MKRKVCIILFSIALAMLIFLLCGCSADEADISPTPQAPQADVEPPKALVFNSIDEYDIFAASIEFPDEDFESFINVNDYSMNGISSKNDVIQVSNQIKSILWPVSDFLDFSQMIIYPDREECFILFSSEEAISCSFFYYLDAAKAADINPLTSGEANYLLPVEMDANEKMADIFYFESEDSGQHSFYARIGGNTALIRVYGTEDVFESVNILNSFSFDTDVAQPVITPDNKNEIDSGKSGATSFIVEIRDREKEEHLSCAEAEEKFYEDKNTEYYFSVIKSHYIIVTYDNGNSEDIVKALNAGRATIADLDRFDIEYHTKPKASDLRYVFDNEDELIDAVKSESQNTGTFSSLKEFYRPNSTPSGISLDYILVKDFYVALLYKNDDTSTDTYFLFEWYRTMKEGTMEEDLYRSHSPDLFEIYKHYYIMNAGVLQDVFWEENGQVFHAVTPSNISPEEMEAFCSAEKVVIE